MLLSIDSEELTQVSHEESWLISFHGCEYLQLHDESFTNSVPDENFPTEFENPAWAGKFALIIKQSLLHESQLLVLSCIVLNLDLLERPIVEAGHYSPDVICLQVHHGSLEHLGKSSSDEGRNHLPARQARNSHSQ